MKKARLLSISPRGRTALIEWSDTDYSDETYLIEIPLSADLWHGEEINKVLPARYQSSR